MPETHWVINANLYKSVGQDRIEMHFYWGTQAVGAPVSEMAVQTGMGGKSDFCGRKSWSGK